MCPNLTTKISNAMQGGHIPAKIKFPVLQIFYLCFFFPQNQEMVLTNTGLARLVITVYIIYGSTHAKKIGHGFHVFFLKA